MKKLIILITAILTLTFSNVVFALTSSEEQDLIEYIESIISNDGPPTTQEDSESIFYDIAALYGTNEETEGEYLQVFNDFAQTKGFPPAFPEETSSETEATAEPTDGEAATGEEATGTETPADGEPPEDEVELTPEQQELADSAAAISGQEDAVNAASQKHDDLTRIKLLQEQIEEIANPEDKEKKQVEIDALVEKHGIDTENLDNEIQDAKKDIDAQEDALNQAELDHSKMRYEQLSSSDDPLDQLVADQAQLEYLSALEESGHQLQPSEVKRLNELQKSIAKVTSLKETTFDVTQNLILEETIDPVTGEVTVEQAQSYFTKNDNNSPVVRLIIAIINFATLIIGTIAAILIIIAGFLLVTSGGNDQNIERGKDVAKYAIIGLVVTFMSYIVVLFVQSIFSN